ncbi:hypothetical protein ACQ3I4_00040 [Zafaria sp. Z1313]|uniref:hypothetical protein n=1 Tax=Zafaria sp. Z1313 TaxID=3423202 RepID=UPI003D302EF6
MAKSDDSLGTALRLANPSPVDADRPLDRRAEEDLERITAVPRAERIAAGLPGTDAPPDGGPATSDAPDDSGAAVPAVRGGTVPAVPRHHALRWGLAAAAAVAVVLAGSLWGTGLGSRAAAAVPAVLGPVPDGESTSAFLDRIRAGAAARPGPVDPGHTDVEHWELGTMWDAAAGAYSDTVTLPVRVETARAGDGSGTRTATVGEPFGEPGPGADFTAVGLDTPPAPGTEADPDAPLVVEEGPFPTVAPGTVEQGSHGAGTLTPTLFPGAPPREAAAFGDYLASFQRRAGAMVGDGAGGMFASVGFLAGEWKLDAAQELALAEALAGQPGVEVAGSVIDRRDCPGGRDHGSRRHLPRAGGLRRRRLLAGHRGAAHRRAGRGRGIGARTKRPALHRHRMST